MKQKIIIPLLVAASMLLAFSGAAQASGDAAAAKEKKSRCEGCHGVEGFRTAYPVAYHVPKIGGQHGEYLIKAMQAYKNGDRVHPTMTAIAETLSEQDIKDFAAYYAGDN